MPISDFYKCRRTLSRHLNCGILSAYLDPFADWLANQGFFFDRFNLEACIKSLSFQSLSEKIFI